MLIIQYSTRYDRDTIKGSTTYSSR